MIVCNPPLLWSYTTPHITNNSSIPWNSYLFARIPIERLCYWRTNQRSRYHVFQQIASWGIFACRRRGFLHANESGGIDISDWITPFHRINRVAFSTKTESIHYTLSEFWRRISSRRLIPMRLWRAPTIPEFQYTQKPKNMELLRAITADEGNEVILR